MASLKQFLGQALIILLPRFSLVGLLVFLSIHGGEEGWEVLLEGFSVPSVKRIATMCQAVPGKPRMDSP